MLEYEEIGPLPKWAYTESEWKALITKADKIIDGHLYAVVEPLVLSDEEKYLQAFIDEI